MNIIPNIVKQLDLNINTEFSLTDPFLAENSDNIYMFTETALVYKNGDTWELSSKLTDILNGNIEISLPPFYPEYGDTYWSFSVSNYDENYGEMFKKENWKLYKDVFSNSFFELVLRDSKLCFRNYDECFEKLKEVYEKYTGLPWKEDIDDYGRVEKEKVIRVSKRDYDMIKKKGYYLC